MPKPTEIAPGGRRAIVECAVYSLKQTSQRLGCSLSTVQRLVREGSLPSIALGPRRLVIPIEAVEKMIRTGRAR